MFFSSNKLYKAERALLLLNKGGAMRTPKHITHTQQFSRDWLEIDFVREVEWMERLSKEKEGPFLLRNVLAGKNILLLFWEPSSRTIKSFSVAAQTLGANVSEVLGRKSKSKKPELVYSSEAKDEIFEDTIRTFACYYDAIIMRHYEEGHSAKAARVIDEFDYDTCAINAGDGEGQHPSQGLVDFYTLKKENGEIDGLHGVFMGDLLGSRVIHSQVYLLGKFKVKMSFVSPPQLKLPKDILDYLDRHGIDYEEFPIDQIERLKKSADFWYVVRLQSERHGSRFSKTELSALEGAYQIDRRFVEKYLREKDRLFHPFPRKNEIVPWKLDKPNFQKRTPDKLPQAGYFKQIKYGQYVRMALLKMLLNPTVDLKALWDGYASDSLIAQCIVCGRVNSRLIGWGNKGLERISHLPQIFCKHCKSKR
jgi:aspartate carbamoyltransferase catalytic subunit